MKRTLIFLGYSMIMAIQLPAQQLIFKNYTAEDGLVSNPIRRIFQDKRGFIWIGTTEGLSKYDGFKFTNYTVANGLSHNVVNDLYESPDEKLYVAENNGDIDILQRDAIIYPRAIQHVVINQFYTTKHQRVIAVTDTSGIHEFIRGRLVKPIQSFPQLTFRDITAINDSLLIAGDEGSLKILNQQLEIVSEIHRPPEVLTFKIYKDSKNKIWIGSNQGLSFVVLNSKNKKEIRYALLPSPYNIPLLKNYIVQDMLEDSIGNFWMGTNKGLVKINRDGNVQVFTEKEGLPSSNIRCLYQDKEANIWIGTSLGLAKWVSKNGISIYRAKSETGSTKYSFLQPLKDDWIITGTENGIHLFNKPGKYFQANSFPSQYVYDRGVKNSNLLILSPPDNGFDIYDLVKNQVTDKVSLPGIGFYCLAIDPSGTIFLGTQNGLCIRSGTKTWYEKDFPHRITTLLLDKKGYLWVGTWNKGLYRIHYTSINDKPAVQDLSGLIPDKSIRYLFMDSHENLWVGTRNQGIAQLIDINASSRVVQYFGLKQGLNSNWVRTIIEDSNRSIWVGTNLGIDKLIPTRESYRIFNFSRINNYYSQINDILPENDHSLWVASDHGLVNISGALEKTPPLPIHITSVELGDPAFNYHTNLSTGKLRLKHDQNKASFAFSAPGFINEKQVSYSYRLLGGIDTIWSEPESIHQVSYASLQPGNYKFEVRTLGWNDEWGIPATFSFSIRPPYWQTWWFYTLIGCSLLLAVYALYNYRIRQLVRLQQVRNRIASDLHDDIGSTLTNINMLAEISRKNILHPLESEKFLLRITDEVTASSQALNDIIWNVTSRNDSMEETIARMRRYAAELFDNSKTLCHLVLDESMAGKKMNMEQRSDVYLIYKESLNNIFKHAGAENVWIEMQLKNKNLILKIKDDGKGFESTMITNRNGLRNIRDRAEKWKGSVKVTTEPGQGTQLEILIPLKE